MTLREHTSDIKIEDVRQIVEVCNPTTLGFNFDQGFWRGHGDAEWPLLPHVFRRNPFPGGPMYCESGLIGHFLVRAPSRSHTKTPEPNDYFGWLFLAQHYGLPTVCLTGAKVRWSPRISLSQRIMKIATAVFGRCGQEC